MTIDEAKNIRGAVYIPARTFNSYQMWREYDRAIIERDLRYAAKLKLNALRVFLSYDYWLEDRGRLENSLYHLLQSAFGHKIRIMPVLFECNGIDPTDEAKADRDPASAVCVRSPHSDLINDPSKWYAIEDYVNWFMQRWAYEHRALALDVINEPRTVAEFKFTRAMFTRASRHRRSLPVTFGAARLEDSRLLMDLGLDILQLHENFQRSEPDFRSVLNRAAETQQILARPVMLTEWQRLRPGGVDKPPSDQRQPAYSTMAPIIKSYPLGNFFWSLMLRPAYVPEQREQGILEGLFHETGAVWSLDDARAISQDPNFSAEERQQWPQWAKSSA